MAPVSALQKKSLSVRSCSLCLSGSVVPRRHVRTNYIPARHCSVPHKGFALSGRVLVITVQQTSNISPSSFWSSLMYSHAPHTLSSRNTRCASIKKAMLSHVITGMAHALAPLDNQMFFFSIVLCQKWAVHWFLETTLLFWCYKHNSIKT